MLLRDTDLRETLADAPWALFLAFAFLSMVSMPAARMAIAASLVFTLASRTARRRLRLTSPTAGWLAYLALALVGSAAAAAFLNDPLLVPAKGLGKLPKLLWFAAIPLCAAHVNSARRFRQTLQALAIGGAVMAVIVLLGHTSFAWIQVHYPEPGATDAPALASAIQRAADALGLDSAVRRWLSDDLIWAQWGGRPPCFLYALLFNATLHDAQRLMVAILAATALALAGGEKGSRRRHVVMAALAAAALVVTCKRAPLAAALVSLGVMLAMLARPWKAIVAVAAICLLAFAVPQSRARLQMMPMEFSLKSGGRALMWTKIAPELHRQHPWGIGFRSLTPRKMESIDRRVEPNRTHLHSTPLQAFIDFGWAGLFVWATWMALVFRAAIGTARGVGGIPAALPRPLRVAPLAMFSALFIVSLVEYNLADAAVVLLYGTALGLAECSRKLV